MTRDHRVDELAIVDQGLASRCANVLVLPNPAPAMTSKGAALLRRLVLGKNLSAPGAWLRHLRRGPPATAGGSALNGALASSNAGSGALLAGAMEIEHHDAMGNDATADAWIEIFSAIVVGETTVRWYVEYCEVDSRSIVADRRTEGEAIWIAKERDLPITHCGRPMPPSWETSAQAPRQIDPRVGEDAWLRFNAGRGRQMGQ